jgi:hypothetical protein
MHRWNKVAALLLPSTASARPREALPTLSEFNR